MEEGRVTAEGQTHTLPTSFFVIATQNPAHQTGTSPLPESQLDRFSMRVSNSAIRTAPPNVILLSRRPSAQPV